MDPALVIATVLALFSIFLGLVLFFLKNLINKIEASSITSANSAIRVSLLEEQVRDIRGMREDIAVLKHEILARLKQRPEK